MPSRLVPLYRPLVSLPQLHSSLRHSGRTNGYRRHMNERSDHSTMQCSWHQQRSSRILWSTVSKAADRSSNANQLRFMVVGKCSAKATKQLCCWSFDNVITQSWIRNIELCCSCSYGHWTFCLLQSLLSLQLALLIHSNSLYGQKEPVSFAHIVLHHISGLATQALGHLDQPLYTHKNPTEYC